MDSNPTLSHPLVHVVPTFLWNMSFHVAKEVRDFTSNLMTEVCHDICVEPALQPITGEVLSHATAISDDGATLDIASNGFWGGCSERALFDMRIFNPHAPSNRQPLPACYRKHENVKKHAYEKIIEFGKLSAVPSHP